MRHRLATMGNLVFATSYCLPPPQTNLIGKIVHTFTISLLNQVDHMNLSLKYNVSVSIAFVGYAFKLVEMPPLAMKSEFQCRKINLICVHKRCLYCRSVIVLKENLTKSNSANMDCGL